MEITWFGHSCFRLTERAEATVVCDPYDSQHVGYPALKLKADIVTISHDSPSHSYLKAIKGEPYVIMGPGEYEVGGVFITGVSTNGHNKKSQGELQNTLYVIDYNGINVVHLGDMSVMPSQTEVEELGPVHVALVPVGDGGGLNAANASEVISMLEPNYVIPMHYLTPVTSIKLDGLNKFLKEMGVSKTETLPSLKITSLEGLPEETRVVVLDYPHE